MMVMISRTMPALHARQAVKTFLREKRDFTRRTFRQSTQILSCGKYALVLDRHSDR